LKQAIVTNKPHAIALASCARTGLAERVDRVQGAGDGFPLKPDPAVAFALMQEFGATAAETALLGDGNADAALARAAGIAFVGCAWGSNSTDRLRELGARRVIESFGEWPGVLNGIERRV
jgi:phosphoglycolate phosphatase